MSTWTRRIGMVAALLVLVPTAAAAEPTPDVAYPDDPQLQRAYESGFFRGSDAGYVEGRDEGYDDGYAAGVREGAAQAREEARAEEDREQLRGEVEEQVQEGGADLGEQLPSTPSPTPAPTATAPTTSPTSASSDTGSKIPWWPLAFAVATTAWFVTRRRRSDAADRDGTGHELR